MNENEMLYERALEAIEDVFTDMSVDSDTTFRNLTSLKYEIEAMLDALES